MANNPQFSGGPGPPLHPSMTGSVGPQNLHPPMHTQFRPLSSMHQMQQFASQVSQQYQPLSAGTPAVNMGMPPPPTQQIQFTQSVQAPARPLPQGHPPPMTQSVTLANIQMNRPVSSALPQPVENMPSQSNFLPVSSGVGMPVPPSYAQNTYPASQFQPVTQMNLQSNPVSRPPVLASGNQGVAFIAPIQQDEQPSASNSTTPGVDSEPKPVTQSSSEWLEHTNNGRRFYYNKKTKSSTWDKPLELMTPQERADATTDWKEYTSPDGRKYYYNKVTKQSKWRIPEELKLAREQVTKQPTVSEVAGNPNSSSQQPEIKTPSDVNTTPATTAILSSPAAVTPGAGSTTSLTTPSPRLTPFPLKDIALHTEAVEVRSPAEVVTSTAAASVVSNNANDAQVESAALPRGEAVEAPDSQKTVAKQDAEEPEKMDVAVAEVKPVEHETPTYANKQEAKDAFKSLLESVNVESDWTWEQTMRLIINDKRYAALKTLGERKQAFNEFTSQRKKQEIEERRAKNRKAREDFKKMLEECSELTSTTRWGRVVSIFEDDDRFKAIERPKDREDMFEEYLVELEKKELVKAEEEHQRNIMEYRKYLESCDFIKANSQWRRVKDRLEADPRCLRLEMMDRLKFFQEYIGDLEKEEEEQKKLQKEEMRKAERKNRDDFRKLMDEHVADGILTSKSTWRDYHFQVKDLPAFLAVAANSSGSTPKELFEDVLEEVKKQYQEDRTRIKDAVKSEKVPLSSASTFEEFKAAITKEIGFPEVSENNLKVVFEELIQRAREKEEKEAKRRKRLGDEFFNMLCSLKDLTSDSKWEECLYLFEAREEFRSMGDESFSRQIFDEYLDQLKEKEREKERKRREEKERKGKDRERDRREKDRKHDRDRGRRRTERGEGDGESDYNELSNGTRKSGKHKDKKHRKRQKDEENDLIYDRNGKEHSRSSRGHSSERKKFRQADEMADSDDESKHKKHKREHHSDSLERVDIEELEDGELGSW